MMCDPTPGSCCSLCPACGCYQRQHWSRGNPTTTWRPMRQGGYLRSGPATFFSWLSENASTRSSFGWFGSATKTVRRLICTTFPTSSTCVLTQSPCCNFMLCPSRPNGPPRLGLLPLANRLSGRADSRSHCCGSYAESHCRERGPPCSGVRKR